VDGDGWERRKKFLGEGKREEKAGFGRCCHFTNFDSDPQLGFGVKKEEGMEGESKGVEVKGWGWQVPPCFSWTLPFEKFLLIWENKRTGEVRKGKGKEWEFRGGICTLFFFELLLG